MHVIITCTKAIWLVVEYWVTARVNSCLPGDPASAIIPQDKLYGWISWFLYHNILCINTRWLYAYLVHDSDKRDRYFCSQINVNEIQLC